MSKRKYRHTEVYKGVRIDKRADTLKELMAKVKKKKEEIDGSSIDGSTPFRDYAVRWAEAYKAPNVCTAWYKDITRRIEQIAASVGNKPIGAIKSIELQQHLNSMTNTTTGHIKKTYDVINQIFGRAYKDGLLVRPIDIECPKGKKVNIGRSLTDQERECLLKALDGHRAELLDLIERKGHVSAIIGMAGHGSSPPFAGRSGSHGQSGQMAESDTHMGIHSIHYRAEKVRIQEFLL